MSMVYDDASVMILKDSVAPTFTLMSVANPWMVLLPDPTTSQTLCGVPGWEFSHTIGLVGGSQGSAKAAGVATTIAATKQATPINARMSPGWPRRRTDTANFPSPRDSSLDGSARGEKHYSRPYRRREGLRGRLPPIVYGF